MEVSNLPNDNIYKFVAFAGLALITLIPYFYITKVLELTSRRTDIRIEQAVIRYEELLIEKDIPFISGPNGRGTRGGPDGYGLMAPNDYWKEVPKNNVQKLGQPESDPKPSKENLSPEKEAEKKKIELDLRKIKLSEKEKELDKYDRYLSFYFWFGLIVWLLGWLLAGIGSWYWYHKIQIRQDKVLEKEANKAS